MALPNVFTSIPAIECWFAAKTTPRRFRAKHFQNCGDYSLSPSLTSSPTHCPYCTYKLDIINHDIDYLTKLCLREIKVFRGGNDWCLSLWHDLRGIWNFYTEQQAKIQRQIDEWVPAEVGANGHTGLDISSQPNGLQKLKHRLEDMIREEDMEIEVAKAKGWI